MLDRLPASAMHRAGARSSGSLFGAAAFHAALIGVLIRAGAGPEAPAVVAAPDTTTVIFVPDDREPDPPGPFFPDGFRCDACLDGLVGVDVTVVIPSDVPDGVRDALRVALPSRPTIPERRPGGLWGGGGPAAPIAAALADEAPVRIGGPDPVYPALLRQAGLAGVVTVEVVIGADGAADAATFRVVEATHAAFVAAARRSVLEGRYRPGRLGGRPVPVLVRQVIRFALR